MTGIDIPRTVSIGKDLMIHHFGGVIIHPQTKIGDSCTLRHGVTIGREAPRTLASPRSAITLNSERILKFSAQ